MGSYCLQSSSLKILSAREDHARALYRLKGNAINPIYLTVSSGLAVRGAGSIKERRIQILH